MKLKTIKILTITLSLIIFIISLTQNAIIIDYIEIKPVSSLTYFLIGSTAFIGGALLEQIIWLANPLSLLSIVLLLNNKPIAIKFSLIALALSISFSTWSEILGDESGSMAKIISLELGYYLWVLSITILSIGTFTYFKMKKKLFEKENTNA
ncbi:hypothetical protein [Flavobacterium sp. ZB4P13]|uniref:hypothetical protein n=1 Tax=Flavobacterium sp. ZB4P13 TaxID=3401728 RepID=UPI003AAB0324